MALLPVLTTSQSSDWDARAVASGHALSTLMECAGRAVAHLVLDRFAYAASHGVLVACGGGNNGGDGWVAARALHALGTPVWAIDAGTAPPDSAAAAARQHAVSDGVRTLPADGPWPGAGLVVDALLGAGAAGAPRPDTMRLLHCLVDLHCPIVAIDGPSGLDLDVGVQHGPMRATVTVTFGGVKRGHLLARDEIGDLVVADIGLPAADARWPVLVTRAWAAARMAPFTSCTYKGTRGRVVIVGGDATMTGAARMVARAAFATGAGLVHVVAPTASIENLQAAEPDVQTQVQDFRLPLAEATRELIARADVVAIGPGLGRAAEKLPFVLEVLSIAKRAVIDADALMLLKDGREALRKIGSDKPVVCTPHVGEFRALFAGIDDALETAPWNAAVAAAQSSNSTVLLKGVPTVVAAPDGQLYTIPAGNPGLGTGGSGDALTGIIATLLAQGHAPADAASIGCCLHGDAADIAARRFGVRTMRPMDVIAALSDVWRQWAQPLATPRAPVLCELPAPTVT